MATLSGGEEVPNIKSLMRLKKKYEPKGSSTLPDSYRHNHDKEKLWLWCCGNFQRQIRFHHPGITALCLAPKNECGVEKLICTFIRPTVLPFSHLHDVEACAHFVSDFIFYNQAKKYSDSINSPSRVLQEQMGNGLEMSCLLVSLLRGFGFSAYVVVGYVDKTTADCDTTGQKYSHLSQEVTAKKEEEDKYTGVYKLKRPLDLTSKYQQFLANRKEGGDGGDKDAAGEEEKEAAEETFHGWVYVETGNTTTFIEATTGMRRPVSDKSYLRINCLFNDLNYWLNLQTETNRKDKKLGLDNTKQWLKLVQDLKKDGKDQENNNKIVEKDKRVGPFTYKKSDEDEEVEGIVKRPFDVIYTWVAPLVIPTESYELLYRMGQKVEKYFGTKVEYFAPYLLKDGMVQRIREFASNLPNAEEVTTTEKYKHRADKLILKVVDISGNKINETFETGRGDRLAAMSYYKSRTGQDVVLEDAKKLTFFHKSRQDGLSCREARDFELKETYIGREDCLSSMEVTFGMVDKIFGPADDEDIRSTRKILKIVERYGLPEGAEPKKSIAERTYNLEEETVFLKFHREEDRILCQTVEMIKPAEGNKTIGEDDVNVYVVDPREDPPSLKELQILYKEQVDHQAVAIARIKAMQEELVQLTELRMKEESANEMSVGLFDTKRNVRVQKGREAIERQERERERSEVDLELDFLAPYLAQYSNPDSLTRAQALKVRDECLENIRNSMEEKEKEMTNQMAMLKEELQTHKSRVPLPFDEINSKKFFINVLETRIKRHKAYANAQYGNAEKKIRNDIRLTKFM